MTIRFSALFDEKYCEINSCINIRNLFEIYIKFREIRDVQADNGTMKKIFLTGSSRNYRNTFSKTVPLSACRKTVQGISGRTWNLRETDLFTYTIRAPHA